jgi:hypothetical protein
MWRRSGDTLVEQLVVKRAQADAVLCVVRALEGPPLHVRGIQARGGAVQPAVEAAERTLVLVGDHHTFPEVAAAAADGGAIDLRRLQVQADLSADVLVERRFEVRVQDGPAQL